jgi:hypothetical protein
VDGVLEDLPLSASHAVRGRLACDDS